MLKEILSADRTTTVTVKKSLTGEISRKEEKAGNAARLTRKEEMLTEEKAENVVLLVVTGVKEAKEELLAQTGATTAAATTGAKAVKDALTVIETSVLRIDVRLAAIGQGTKKAIENHLEQAEEKMGNAAATATGTKVANAVHSAQAARQEASAAHLETAAKEAKSALIRIETTGEKKADNAVRITTGEKMTKAGPLAVSVVLPAPTGETITAAATDVKTVKDVLLAATVIVSLLLEKSEALAIRSPLREITVTNLAAPVKVTAAGAAQMRTAVRRKHLPIT